MISGLEWIGARARWILVIGSVAALLLQDLASVLRPYLPVLVAALYTLAMVRIDLVAMVRGAMRPARFVRLIGLCGLLMIATPAIVWLIAQIFSLPEDITEVLVYATAAPPLGSAAALCLLLGLNAAFALELTILGSFLTPVFGPLVTIWLLGEAVPIEPLALAGRLALIVAAGAAMAIAVRAWLGGERIASRAKAFDGVGALVMLVTIVPIFDGVTAQIIGSPGIAVAILALVVLVNFGLQMVAAILAGRLTDAASAGALGLTWGNRNTALYLAALPPSPMLALFVGLYQFPMYATPLAMGPFYKKLRNTVSKQ